MSTATCFSIPCDEQGQDSPLKGLDDAAVARMTTPEAGAELQHRLRFEAAWSGEWQAGAVDGSAQVVHAPPPIPAHWNRPRKGKTISGQMQSRAEVRKLYAQARNGSKPKRAAAVHILRTRYGQSVS
jgi:hypothetical protein